MTVPIFVSVGYSDGDSGPIKLALKSDQVPQATPTDHASTLELVREGEGVIEATRSTLLAKLTWANNELKHCSSVESCNQLCQLIQTISTTLKHLES